MFRRGQLGQGGGIARWTLQQRHVQEADLKKLVIYGTVAGSVMAMWAVAVGAWNAADYLDVRPIIEREFTLVEETQNETIQQIQQSVFLARWLYLKQRLENNGILSFDELQEFCRLTTELKFVAVHECQ
jgi:hypothetical protein